MLGVANPGARPAPDKRHSNQAAAGRTVDPSPTRSNTNVSTAEVRRKSLEIWRQRAFSGVLSNVHSSAQLARMCR